MTNETKLWQLRAGLITEAQYQEAIDEPEEVLPTSAAPTDKSKIGSATAYATDRRVAAQQLANNPDKKNMNATEASTLAQIIKHLEDLAMDPKNDTALLKQILTFVNTRIKK